MSNKYLNAFKRMDGSLDKIAPKYNKKKSFFYWDAFCSFILYGVTPNEYIGFGFYKKSRLERKTFYTARMQSSMERKLNSEKYNDIFWKKQLFNKEFSNWVKRDWLYTPESNKEDIKEFLSKHDKVIVKPIDGSSGKGIHVYNGESVDELVKSEYLLETFVKQHPKIAECNPSSVNTIRCYTILDKIGQPHILACSIRVGGTNSAVDNFHAGGVRYPINLETGYICAIGKNILGEEFLIHPSTNKKMIGFEIPNWTEFVDFIFSAVKHIPEARFIAWDVAVLETGFEMIEANYMGDPAGMQAALEKGKLLEIKKFINGTI